MITDDPQGSLPRDNSLVSAHRQATEFRLLGPVEVLSGGRQQPLGGKRQRKVLAMLLLHNNLLVSQADLVDALWEDNPPGTARKQVKNAISKLRRSLGFAQSVIVTVGACYRVNLSEEQVDAQRFQRALDSARREAAAGRLADAVQMLDAALGMWRGPALADLTGRRFENAAASLEEQRLVARELLIDLRLASGSPDGLIPELTELVAAHPFRERFGFQLMLALYRSGRQSDALAVYARIRSILAEELGLDPGQHLRSLHERILRNDSALLAPGTGDGPAPAPVARLAEHRLATVADRDTRRPPNLLPYDIADFTGRSNEVAALIKVGTMTGTALAITALDGMAGVGKTALVVRAARLLAPEYMDGQMFIDLNGTAADRTPLTPSAALGMLLRSLGVPPNQVPSGLAERAARWRLELAGRRVLVVLDNALDSGQVQPLLPGSPVARVLITSRQRLTAVNGASWLSLKAMTPGDAADLFRKILVGHRAESPPDLVGELVDICGYLPLAIRIAATRLRQRPHWTIQSLAARLRDQNRLLTELSLGGGVTAAFSASYLKLTAAQRRQFRLLGLHPAAAFDANAAAALAGITCAESEQLLEVLLDANMLEQHAADRYDFHSLLRQYARAMAELEESPNELRLAMDRLVRLSRRVLAAWWLVSVYVVLKPSIPDDVEGDAVEPTPEHASVAEPVR